MTVAELKEVLKAKGLTTTGKKSDLVERLQLAKEEEEADDNPEEASENALEEDDDEDADDEEETFKVEKLLKTKTVKGKVFYLVKWDGWAPEFNTWEPKENVGLPLIELFESEQKKK